MFLCRLNFLKVDLTMNLTNDCLLGLFFIGCIVCGWFILDHLGLGFIEVQLACGLGVVLVGIAMLGAGDEA